MYRNIILILLLLLIAVPRLPAQTVILERDNLLDSNDGNFGPNRRHFLEIVYGMSFLFGPEEQGARLNTSGSYNFKFGWRYKLKINPTFAVGSEINSINSRYSLESRADKLFGTLETHNTELFNTWLLNLQLYFRTNFDPHRGDFLGTFFDIGTGSGFMLSSSYLYRDEIPVDQIREVKYSKLQIVQRLQTHTFLRVGYNNFSLYFSYRISSLFKPGEQQRLESTSKNVLPEFPRMALGLELAFP